MACVAPSILAADFARLGEQVLEVERAGADRIHIDVMDGHFVPNLSMGPVVVKALRPLTRLPLEVHLMVEEPDQFIDVFVRPGADTVIGHLEAMKDPQRFVRDLRQADKKVGLALKPETEVDLISPYLATIDLALCMTVHPGFGGQDFLPESPPRIRRLRQLLDRLNPGCDLEVDGGIDENTAQVCVQAGATVLVAGTSIFGSADGPTESVHRLLFLIKPDA
jgi:ribulose-phosphate 3-epimerase